MRFPKVVKLFDPEVRWAQKTAWAWLADDIGLPGPPIHIRRARSTHTRLVQSNEHFRSVRGLNQDSISQPGPLKPAGAPDQQPAGPF